MAINAQAADRLLNGIIGETTEYDSDECSTEDEEDIAERTTKSKNTSADLNDGANDMKDKGNYHKMTEVQTRTYQVELLNIVRKPGKNFIVCLPTGSGKTFVSLKLAEEMLPDAIANNQKIIFLANNVPLVHQQAKYFSANLVNTCLKDDNYVRAISGDLNTDFWKEEQWNEILSSYHILVLSTQIFLDAITKAYIKWSQVALLILDECHHAQKDHPMAVLMRNYGEKKASRSVKLPKVLGLTATIIKGQSKEHKIPDDIQQIETLLCARAITHPDYEEVLKYSTSAIITPVTFVTDHSSSDSVCHDVSEFMELLKLLPKNFATEEEISIIESINHPSLTSEEQIYNRHKGVPRQLHSFLLDLLKTYEEMGLYCCKLASILKIVYIMQWIQELDDMALDSNSDHGDDDDTDNCEEDVTVLTLLYTTKTVLAKFLKCLENEMEKKARDAKVDPSSTQGEAFVIRECVSDKLKVLWNILESKRNAEDICGLIFCQRRITAQVLRWYLEKAAELFPDELGFIKPELMLGNSTNVANTEVSKFTAKRQTEIIRRFHEKGLNLLVATQVVEEGLNVPACNLVVRFDPILSYPSLVQSMGRARKPGAICYALFDVSEEQKELGKIKNYINYNKKLAIELERNAIHVGEDDHDFPDNVTADLIPPFRPSEDPNGPIITATDAISLVHRYCNSLSCDRLASLVATSFWEESGESPPRYKAFVLLPILSPVNEIVEGKWMPDKTLAKRSAFMEVCKKLYYADELTPNLLPKPRTIDNFKCEFLQNLDEKYEEEKQGANGKIGTRKRVLWYQKKIPIALETNLIGPRTPVAAYRIKIKLTSYTGNESFKSLYDFGKYEKMYGILTQADLSKVQNFTLLANYGTLEVSIKKCRIYGGKEACFTDGQLRKLRTFQTFLLQSVYRSSNPILKLEDSSSFIVAPFVKNDRKKSFVVDWDVVESVLNTDEKELLLSKPSSDARELMKFDPSKFENAIIAPWYKGGAEPELFCSIKILEDMNAKSEFDDTKKSGTFAEYFAKKYGVELLHPEFPLIQCKELGKQLNFLSRKTDGREMRRDMLRSNVKMVPELVNIHTLPASLLVQGRYLPSIIHRIFRLLLVDEMIRQKVASYFSWDIETEVGKDLTLPSPSPPSINNDESNGAVLHPTNVPDPCPLNETSFLGETQVNPKDKKKERTIVLLETINPLKITWNHVIKEKRKKSIRDDKISMPGPPCTKSDAQSFLMPIDEIKFPSFDKPTDFTVEKGPSMEDVMEALTLSNAQDCIDLERQEILGDSVLKLIVSLHIFRNFSTWDEGKMTLLRMKLICNRHLFQLGKKHEIAKMLSGSIFIPAKHWLPPGFTVPQTAEELVLSKSLDYGIFQDIPASAIEEESFEDYLTSETLEEYTKDLRHSPHTSFTHSKVSDKSVADSVEALIGVYHEKGGIDGAMRFMEWFGFRGPLADGSSTVYSRENSLSPPPTNPYKKQGTQNLIPLLADLEEVICYKFKNQWLAVEALTHGTYMGNRITSCYERLEFVGDALLDYLVTVWILNNTNIKDPGKVTDLRSALVNNVTFGSLAVRYGFHKFLKYNSETLSTYMMKFEQYQEDNDHEVGDPHELFSDFDCPTVREIEVPKVLGDIFESIAGAVFVDSGMSIDTTWKVFYRLMKNELEKFSKNIPKNPMRQLYEDFPVPGKVKFRKIEQNTGDDSKSNRHEQCATKFQIVSLQIPCSKSPILGIGATVKQAKQAAAKYAVRLVKTKD